ncbi:DUF3180 family protein [Tessaracoccus sp. ZS01]|uniref:DUF3180 family protein n=1 Tax=Tessaracoccus sp. ZS01 TaxID=1906324 RepID=UPI00096EC7AB|nr:DUF3180 family protein [Tessaracoccus sp. ZS01]
MTTPRQAVVSVLSGAVIFALVILGFEAAGQFPPVVPWSVPIMLVGLALAVAIYSRALPKRIEEKRLAPQEGLAALAVGKSMIMTGALFAGGHIVYVMRYLSQLDAALPSARVIQGSATIVAALLLAGAGALLERACVIPDDDDDEDKPDGASPSPA